MVRVTHDAVMVGPGKFAAELELCLVGFALRGKRALVDAHILIHPITRRIARLIVGGLLTGHFKDAVARFHD